MFSLQRPRIIAAVGVVAFLSLAVLVHFTGADGSSDQAPVRTLCNVCAIELAGKTSGEDVPPETRKTCPICGLQKLDPKFEESICEGCAQAEQQCRRCLLSLGWPEHLDKIEPVHNRIYFVSDRDGEPEIYSMAPEGTDLLQLTKNEFYDSEPSVSPDGKWVAFVSLRNNVYDLFIVDVHGKHERRLTFSAALEATPAWYPDGERMVITVNNGPKEPRDLYSIRRDGLCLTMIEVDCHLVNCWDPCVSPDGLSIVFSHYIKKGDPWQILVRNDSGVVSELTQGRDNYSPVYSSDGSKIVFDSSRDKDCGKATFEIYVMNPDGSGQKRLTDNKFHDSMPCWSPDGTKIAFVRILENQNEDIFVMNADGSCEKNISTNARTDNMPCWR